MRISEYIQQLEAVLAEVGDVEVHTEDAFSYRRQAPRPKAAFTRVLRGREVRPRFWHEWDGEDVKGEPVCRI